MTATILHAGGNCSPQDWNSYGSRCAMRRSIWSMRCIDLTGYEAARLAQILAAGPQSPLVVQDFVQEHVLDKELDHGVRTLTVCAGHRPER